MRMKSKLYYLTFILTSAFFSLGNSQTKEQALKDAQLTAQAAVTENIDLLLDHTLPSVVKLMGGHESAKAMLDQRFKSMKAQGMRFEKSEILSVSDIVNEQGQYRCVAENHVQMLTTEQRIVSKSYLLGVYNDIDGYWWFIEAKQLQTPALAEQILPGFETQLKLPNDDVRFETLDN